MTCSRVCIIEWMSSENVIFFKFVPGLEVVDLEQLGRNALELLPHVPLAQALHEQSREMGREQGGGHGGAAVLEVWQVGCLLWDIVVWEA